MKTKENAISTVSMICGILAVLLSCFGIGIIPALAGLVLSIICIAKKKGNKIFYTIGIVTSICAILAFASYSSQNNTPDDNSEIESEYNTEEPDTIENLDTTEISNTPETTDVTETEITDVTESINTEDTEKPTDTKTDAANETDNSGSEIPNESSTNGNSSSAENNSGNNGSSSVTSDEPIGRTVYISATDSKYHRINNCGNMNPNKARQMTEQEAIAQGYGKCKNCW